MRIGDVFRLDFEAKLQEDGHSSYGPVKGLNTWELHRNRFGVQGNLFKHIEYEIEREFTEKELTEKDILLGITPNSQWKDVNVNLTYIKNAQIQVGKFKVPFGLDELTGVTHNDFVYRSLGANYLAPARDIGGMVHGRFFKRGLNYWAGVFKHDGDNARSKKIQGGGRTFAARVTGTPFRRLTASSLGGIEIGTAFAISELSDDSFRPERAARPHRDDAGHLLRHGVRERASAAVGSRRRLDGGSGVGAGGVHLGQRRSPRPGHRQRGSAGRARAVVVRHRHLGPDRRGQETAAQAGGAVHSGRIGAIEVAARFERLWFDSVPWARTCHSVTPGPRPSSRAAIAP